MAEPVHDDHHHHGHSNDRGLSGIVRYLRWAPQMWRSEINEAVIDLVAPTRGETVVDIGAGMGAATVRAAKAGARVVAVEPTPFLRGVLRARRLFQKARKRIVVVDGGAEQLPVDDHVAVAVWATNTMHHWVDADRAVTEIARVLARGGRVVLVDEDFENPDHPEFERFGGDDHDHGFHTVDTAAMGQRLEAAGLHHIETGPRILADRPVLAVTARGPER